MRSLYFYSIIFGFFAGVFVANNFNISYQSFLAIAVVGVVSITFLILHARRSGRPLAHPLIIILLCATAFSVGGARMQVDKDVLAANSLQNYAGYQVTVAGVAQGDADPNDTSATVRVYALTNRDETVKVGGENLLIKFLGESLRYGDKIVLSGVLKEPENFESKDGTSFDYVSYLRKGDILVTMDRPHLVHKEEGEASLTSILYGVRNWFIENVNDGVPEPESSLANGVTVAGKGALPKSVKDDFIKAGVIHVVVLSGYNIAIVASMLLSLFGFLGRRWAASISLVGIGLFVILSGAAAPVVRAAIMASIVLVGAMSYTSVIQNRALFFAAALMVLWNPVLLTSDASFALSFLATFAIVNVVPVISPYFGGLTSKLKIKETLSETLATQIFVLPYLLYEIGRLSIVAPLSNVVILPFIPAIMLLCFIVGLLGFIPLVTLPLAAFLYLLCYFVISASHLFASLPFASLDVSISLWSMIGMYVLYFMAGYFLINKTKSEPRRQ